MAQATRGGRDRGQAAGRPAPLLGSRGLEGAARAMTEKMQKITMVKANHGTKQGLQELPSLTQEMPESHAQEGAPLSLF